MTSKTGSSLSTAVPLLSKHAIDSESRSNSMSVVSALGSDPYSEDEVMLESCMIISFMFVHVFVIYSIHAFMHVCATLLKKDFR